MRLLHILTGAQIFLRMVEKVKLPELFKASSRDRLPINAALKKNFGYLHDLSQPELRVALRLASLETVHPIMFSSKTLSLILQA